MSKRERNDLTPEQRRAQEAVRGLSRPPADAAFRERLKAGFASGSIASREARSGPRGKSNSLRRIVYVALAASVLLVAGVLLTNPRPGPEPIGTNGKGTVTIDGVTVAADRTDELAELLRPGATITLAEGAELDIDYPGTMSLRLYSGTTITLPEAPGRWLGKSVAAHLELGEASILTRDGFSGADLAVSTDEGRVIVSGTLVSVVRNAEVTCVCVEEGTARMEADGVELGPVSPGRRWILFRDGRAPVETEMAPPHRDHLLEFRKSVR